MLRNVKDNFKFPLFTFQLSQDIRRPSLQNPNAFNDFFIFGSYSLLSAANPYLDLYI